MRATEPVAVAVLGGGVIGLSIAFELGCRGTSVALVDPEPGHGATWAAAGMLSPATETAPGEERLVGELCEAYDLWPSFATRVEAAAHRHTGFAACSSVLVGATASDRREVDRTAALIAASGLKVEVLSPAELSTIEPAIGLHGVGGWVVRDDRRVDNRALVDALLEAVAAVGVRLVPDRCLEVRTDTKHLQLGLASGEVLEASSCVLATGAERLPDGVSHLGAPDVRPVRGVTIRLGAAHGALSPRSTVRGVVDSMPCYIVPREDGSVVVGATSEERGFAKVALAGGVRELLDAACAIVPALDELPLEEVSVGLRPATSDHLPVVTRLTDPRIVAALGHYRNGVLLAPLAAIRAVAAIGTT